MYVVTGGAGFIGANIVEALNQRGITDVLVVDNLERGDKFLNLTGCEIADFLDKRDFIALIRDGQLDERFDAVFHEGACSDTMEHNGRYMMENNYEYSKSLLHYCDEHRIPYLYASSAAVYGGGRVFRESREYEAPLNVYGYSKFLFDQYVRAHWSRLNTQVAGFRYFNVYGPHEQHKGRMASVAFHHYNQLQESGKVRLFEGYDGYGNGEQSRDFIYVGDVVDVNLWFLDHPEKRGIFNLGTGRAQPFNDIAHAAVNTMRRLNSETELSLPEMVDQGILEYIDFPEALKGKYQSYTEADMSALRAAGYTAPFLSVAEGVGKYVESLHGNAGTG